MKIHNALANAIKKKTGKVLTFKEIQNLVLQSYPYLKPSSILPAEHASGPKQGRNCSQCKYQPIFNKIGHGVYRVLETALQPSLFIHEKLATVLKAQEGQVVSIQNIKNNIQQMFPDTHLPSIIPADHIRGGACKICNQSPLLERTGTRGQYRVRIPSPSPIPTSDIPRQKLKELLQNKDHAVLHQSPESFKKYLEQCCQQKHSRETYLLTLALVEQIPFDILESHSMLSQSLILEKLANRLYERCGIAREFALWTVKSWIEALQPNVFYDVHIPDKHLEDSQATYAESKHRITHADCHLNDLTINHTATGYDSLKKAHRNVAMVLYIPQTNKYLLGIKKSYVFSSIYNILKNTQILGNACPPSYIARFSPQARKDWPHQQYEWFQGLSKLLVIKVFQALDQQF